MKVYLIPILAITTPFCINESYALSNPLNAAFGYANCAAYINCSNAKRFNLKNQNQPQVANASCKNSKGVLEFSIFNRVNYNGGVDTCSPSGAAR